MKPNSSAPDFSLQDQDGNIHTLEQYKGKWVLLYFYPKDNTPGCTIEACTIKDSWKEFEKHNCIVFGISKDSVASHKKFADSFSLPFTLLSDESTKMIEAYGAWQEKSMYGKKYMGIARMSVLINPEGNIAKIYEKVKPAEHAQEVLVDLQVHN